MELPTFGIWSKANEAFIATGHLTPGDALIQMLLLVQGQPAHDEREALQDLSVRQETAEGPGPDLSEFVGDVLDELTHG